MRAELRCLFLLAAISLLLIAANCRRDKYQLTDEKTPSQTAGDGWLEAAGERILPLIDKHDTEYAPGYREEVFSKVALGVTEAEVARLLGPPLQTKQFSDGTTCWYYTRHGERFASYFVRILKFDQQGILIARRHYFYVG
jgi:hypothetical protein